MLYRRPLTPPVAGEQSVRDAVSLTVAPNPSPRTVSLSVPRAGLIQISVLDALGREVARLGDGHARAGRHEYEWPAELPSGLYVVWAQTAEGYAVTPAVVAR